MSLGQELAPHLPFLRRYARALTGSQNHGDNFVRATLEAIVAAPGDFPREVDPRLGLYRTFHAIWSSANIEEDPGAGGSDNPEGIAQARLARITPLSRQALLLTAMEGFTAEDAGYLIGAAPDEVDRLVAEALAEIERQTATRVLIIEDEPIIALDIQELVERCGHSVVGIASTEAEAVEIAEAERPGLVLADINLGAGGDGTSAVARILRTVTTMPVIFVTAYPERLLTGEALEPAFVITKPFDPTTLAVATYQAVTRGVSPV
jgi:CheY-like chemotaxis protein